MKVEFDQGPYSFWKFLKALKMVHFMFTDSKLEGKKVHVIIQIEEAVEKVKTDEK